MAKMMKQHREQLEAGMGTDSVRLDKSKEAEKKNCAC
jgi:hypothetical protein